MTWKRRIFINLLTLLHCVIILHRDFEHIATVFTANIVVVVVFLDGLNRTSFNPIFLIRVTWKLWLMFAYFVIKMFTAVFMSKPRSKQYTAYIFFSINLFHHEVIAQTLRGSLVIGFYIHNHVRRKVHILNIIGLYITLGPSQLIPSFLLPPASKIENSKIFNYLIFIWHFLW